MSFTITENTTEQELRDYLETGYDDVYNTDQVREKFTVHNFSAPFVFVTRKADGVDGTLEFTHRPRLYFNFVKNN